MNAQQQGRYDDAIALFEEILKSAPSFAPAYVGIAQQIESKGGDLEEIVYYLKKAIAVDASNVMAYEHLGRIYQAAGQFDKAIDVFEKGLKINPTHPGMQAALAWIYLMGQNNPSKAVVYFNKVIPQAPTANNYFGLGMAYFATNDRLKAMDVLMQLKSMGADELAAKLEVAMRQAAKVTGDPMAVGDNAAGLDTVSDNSHQGVKVRLRGKLSDL